MGENMNIYDYTQEELESFLIENGYKKFNALQIIDWMYDKKEYDFNKMTNLSKKLISFLNENMIIKTPEVIKVEKSDLANKYLLRLEDNNKIECVLMNHDYGYSLCVSSQVVNTSFTNLSSLFIIIGYVSLLLIVYITVSLEYNLYSSF